MSKSIARKIVAIVLQAVVLVCALSARETRKEFQERYTLLVSQFGYSGIGVETLLNKWEKKYPDDADMMSAKFLFYFTKASSTEIKPLPFKKYMGTEPVLTLRDSLDNPVNYFQITKYDDELFGKAIIYIDKVILQRPDALELRESKISSYIRYEKDSPDMATRELISLIDYNMTQKPVWTYQGEENVDRIFFDMVIHQLSLSIYVIGGNKCSEAFRQITERMLKYDPKNPLFLDDLGTYYLVSEGDFKKAEKNYKKALKQKKDDLAALSNLILIARKTENTKMEKKYLKQYVKYGDSEDAKVRAAKMRLKVL